MSLYADTTAPDLEITPNLVAIFHSLAFHIKGNGLPAKEVLEDISRALHELFIPMLCSPVRALISGEDCGAVVL